MSAIVIHLGRYPQDILGFIRSKCHRPQIVRPCHMQIKPCREALMAGFGGSVGASWLEIVALIDQLRRSATGSLKQNSASSDVKITM
jgi:hypothetical protein